MDGEGFGPGEEPVEGGPYFAPGQGHPISRAAAVEASVVNEAAFGVVEEKIGSALGIVSFGHGLFLVHK